jgi:predicted ATPase
MMTVTGVPGVGKTRLGLHLASQVRRRFTDGVWLIELAALSSGDLLAETVSNALGIRDRAARPVDAITAALADRRTLLILDNCEHVVDACAQLATTLLKAAPKLRILATSRLTLGIAGEYVLNVPPFRVPQAVDGSTPEGVSRNEAAQLFAARAAQVLPDFRIDASNFATVAEICDRLEGVPLAIELAAGRLRTQSLEEILAGLDERFAVLTTEAIPAAPEHHRTLQATIDWSFHLCSPTQQRLWARSSVFSGGFDLDAAEAVCSDDTLPAEDSLPLVTGLVDLSVLNSEHTAGRARFRSLETIRQYGQHRLMELKETAALRRRHRDHYLHLAQEADTNWFGPDQLSWFSRIRSEHANIRTALEYCCTEPDQAHTGLRMSGALWFYWLACGYAREGRHWLNRLLALDTRSSPERANALWTSAWAGLMQGDTAHASAMLADCWSLAHRLDDELILSAAAQVSGITELLRNDQARAVEYFEEAIRHEHASGQHTGVTIMNLPNLAFSCSLLGDTQRAHALCQECRALCNQRGEQWALSWALWVLAVATWVLDEPSQAGSYAQDALLIKYAFNDLVGIALSVEVLAWVAARTGNAEHAALLLGANEKLWKRVGKPLLGFSRYLRWHDQCHRQTRQTLGDQAFDAAYRHGEHLTIDQTVTTARRTTEPAVAGRH